MCPEGSRRRVWPNWSSMLGPHALYRSQVGRAKGPCLRKGVPRAPGVEFSHSQLRRRGLHPQGQSQEREGGLIWCCWLQMRQALWTDLQCPWVQNGLCKCHLGARRVRAARPSLHPTWWQAVQRSRLPVIWDEDAGRQGPVRCARPALLPPRAQRPPGMHRGWMQEEGPGPPAPRRGRARPPRVALLPPWG